MAPRDMHHEEGEDAFTEMRRQIKAIFEMLQGSNGGLGLSQKVAIMWRIHVWLQCTASAAVGGALALVIKSYFVK